MSLIPLTLVPQDLMMTMAHQPDGVFCKKLSPTALSSTKSRQRRRKEKESTAAAAAAAVAPAAAPVIKSKVAIQNGTRFLNNPYYAGTPIKKMKQQAQPAAAAAIVDLVPTDDDDAPQVQMLPHQMQMQQQPVPVDVYGLPMQPRFSSELPPVAPVQQQQQQQETAFEAQQRLRGFAMPPPQHYAASEPGLGSSGMFNSSSSSSGAFNHQQQQQQLEATIPQPPMMPSPAQVHQSMMMMRHYHHNQQHPSQPQQQQPPQHNHHQSPLVSAYVVQHHYHQQQQQRQHSSDDESFVQQPIQPKAMQPHHQHRFNESSSVSNASFGHAAAISFASESDAANNNNNTMFDAPATEKLQHVYAPNTSFVVVAFKHELCTYQCGFYVVESDWVVVQADRGEHVGRVRSVSSEPPLFHVPSRILRHANFAEISTVESARPNEEYAAQRIQQIATELGLALRIVDTEFYSDGTKMTIFFACKNTVDFRELQRVVFREFRRRIWLINLAEVQYRNKNCRNRK